MLITVFLAAALIAMVVVLSGCATTASNTSQGTAIISASGDIQLAQQKWVVQDKWFNDKLTFTEARAKSDTGFLKVQITVTNLTRDTIRYETKFEWYDANGFKLDNSAELWKPGLIYGKGAQEISGIAPSTSAVSYKFQIRRTNQVS
jgi:uncharacterized protein YcfL